MEAAIYARISEDREETQLGVSRQVDDCRVLCRNRGWNVFDQYVDNDISAYSGKRRPHYERMLADIAARQVTAVVVWHQDRLHRQPRELEAFFDVCDQAGLRDLASVSGDVDLSTDDGRMKARIMGAVARNQSDAASRRIQRKARENAMAGRVAGGGTRAFGFEDDRVTIRASEAEIIRELAERLIAGESLRGLATDLNARGIRSSSGGRWIPSPTLRRLLRSARISGQREHHGEIVAKADWPAIITPEQTTTIRALLDDPSRRPARAARSYLLKGLVRCGHCGQLMVARPRGDGARRYICARGPQYVGCGHSYVLSEPLEEFISEAVLDQLDSPSLARAIDSRAARVGEEWLHERDRALSRLRELGEAFGNDQIGMPELIAAREPLQRKLDDVQRRIARAANAAAITGHIGNGGALRKKWPSLSIDQRHAIIAAVLVGVSVKPARRGYNRFDPSRFDPSWRY